MNFLSAEFQELLRTVIVIAAIIGGFAGSYVAAARKVNAVSKTAEQRSKTNTESIETLQKDLQQEREARQSAIASLEEWKNKYAASQDQIRQLEARISLQDKEIADYKKAMNDYQAESQELRGQLEFERELRGAMKQQNETSGAFMTDALRTVERIVAPLVQMAAAKSEALPTVPAKAEVIPA